MPLTASQVTNPVRSAEMTYTLDDGSKEVVHFSYRPGVVTKAFLKEVQGAVDMTDNDEDAAKRLLDSMVLRLIASWDVLAEVGSEARLPLTPEALFPLDAEFEGQLLWAAMQHMKSRLGGARRGTQKPARSPNTWNRKAKTTPSRKV